MSVVECSGVRTSAFTAPVCPVSAWPASAEVWSGPVSDMSQTMIAFLMKPWICIMKEMGVNPRILADDIMIWDDSKDQEKKFRDAFDATICFYLMLIMHNVFLFYVLQKYPLLFRYI